VVLLCQLLGRNARKVGQRYVRHQRIHRRLRRLLRTDQYQRPNN
jgi:hypothetical protein